MQKSCMERKYPDICKGKTSDEETYGNNKNDLGKECKADEKHG